MARVKGAMMTRKRRNKILKLAKGYWGSKSKHFKMANQAVMKSLTYAYTGRRLKKRDFRQPVDHPHLRRLQDERHELLQLHARPEGRRHRDQPQDALRAGYHRSRRVHPAGGNRQEGLIRHCKIPSPAIRRGDFC